jgi:hypothetical protein
MKSILTPILITLILIFSSCNEALNPIPNIYRSLTNGSDFITLKESGHLKLKILKYEDQGKLVKAKVNIIMPDKKEITLITDTSGVITLPVAETYLNTGYCSIEVCHSSANEQYYGNNIFFLNKEMDSKISIFVNKGHCERKFIKIL